MAKLNANPNVTASAAFDVVKPGVYKLRVRELNEFIAKESGNKCLQLEAEYVDISNIDKLDGGQATNPGTIRDYGLVMEPADKQGKLRGLVEACGMNWGDLDTDELIGKEFEAKVGTEPYNGEPKNVIKRYLKRQ